ncbi:MAG: hypothetical protein IJV91_09355 [Kiritimatiellae bacterium]|nr:hypothetical protein [Kiritimatiellia bacterium]
MKKKLSAVKICVLVLGIGWIPSALAYSVRAWQGKTVNDLSDRKNWSDSASLLEKELAVGFIPGGTYYMGADCAFARLLMNQQDAGTVEFALGEGRTLTLLGSDSSAAFRATVNGSHSVLKVTSGTVAQVFEPGVSQKNGAVYQLADAATVGFTNIYEGASTTLNAHFLHHAFGTNNWLIARNGAVVNADLRFGGGTSYGNGVMIDNATLNLASWTNNYYRSLSILDGSSDYFCVGFNNGSYGDSLILANGGTIKNPDGNAITKWCIGYNGADSAKLVFDGNECVYETTGRTCVGGYNKSCSNTLSVTGGAHLKMTGSNGRFWTGRFSGDNFNTISVSGAGTKLTGAATSDSIVGREGSGNVLDVSDGAEVTLSGGLRVGSDTNACANVLRVSGGSKLDIGSKTLYVGYLGCSHSNRVSVSGMNSSLSCGWMLIGSQSWVAFGNTLNVGDGASVSLGTLDVCGSNSVLRIDNASVAVSKQAHISTPNSVCSGEAIFEIAGANPSLHATETLRIRKSTSLRFELPSQTYTRAPLSSDGRIEIIGNSTIALSFPETLRQITRYTLVETSGTVGDNAVLYVEGGTWANILANLTQNDLYRCTLAKEDKRLVLTVRPHFGTVISFR